MLSKHDQQAQQFAHYRKLAESAASSVTNLMDQEQWPLANAVLAEAIRYLRWIEIELEDATTQADYLNLHGLYVCRGILLIQKLDNIEMAVSCFKMTVATFDKLKSPTDTQRRQASKALNYLINIIATHEHYAIYNEAARCKKLALIREYLLKDCDILNQIQEKTVDDLEWLDKSQNGLNTLVTMYQTQTKSFLTTSFYEIKESDVLEMPEYFKRAYLRNAIDTLYKKLELSDEEHRTLAKYLLILESELIAEDESMDGKLEYFELFILNIPSSSDTLVS